MYYWELDMTTDCDKQLKHTILLSQGNVHIGESRFVTHLQTKTKYMTTPDNEHTTTLTHNVFAVRLQDYHQLYSYSVCCSVPQH